MWTTWKPGSGSLSTNLRQEVMRSNTGANLEKQRGGSSALLRGPAGSAAALVHFQKFSMTPPHPQPYWFDHVCFSPTPVKAQSSQRQIHYLPQSPGAQWTWGVSAGLCWTCSTLEGADELGCASSAPAQAGGVVHPSCPARQLHNDVSREREKEGSGLSPLDLFSEGTSLGQPVGSWEEEK